MRWKKSLSEFSFTDSVKGLELREIPQLQNLRTQLEKTDDVPFIAWNKASPFWNDGKRGEQSQPFHIAAMLSSWLYHSPSLAQRLQELHGYKWGTALVIHVMVNSSAPPSRVSNDKLVGGIKGSPHFRAASPWELWPRCTRWWLKISLWLLYIYIYGFIDARLDGNLQTGKVGK